MKRLSTKKIPKRRFLDYLNFSDPSPHRQQVGSATLPQGESD